MTDTMSRGQAKPVEAALCRFAKSDSMADRLDSLRGLMKGGAIHAAQADPEFAAGIHRTIDALRSADDPQRRLLALAIVARVASRLKGRRTELGREIAAALEAPPPPLGGLPDADDRAYAAQALQWASGDWLIPYTARSIVEEEAGEKARTELVRVLLANAPDLAVAFAALRDPLAGLRPDTESPADSVGKRLKRILATLRKEILLADNPPGGNIGNALESLVAAAFRGVGEPASPRVAEDVTIELARMLHDLAKVRFSLATEAPTYNVLRVPARWYPHGRWPPRVRKSLDVVSRTIEEAMTLLAKQGVTDDGLMKALTTVEGSRERALRITARIAARTSGLRDDVVQWLLRGRVVRDGPGSDLLFKSGLLATDNALGHLLIDARRLARLVEKHGQEISTVVSIFEHSREAAARALVTRAKAVANGVDILGRKRSLRVRGVEGEVVDYLPNEHEGISGAIAGARRVRIVQPLVERIRGDGIAEVVVKAAVEPEKSVAARELESVR